MIHLILLSHTRKTNYAYDYIVKMDEQGKMEKEKAVLNRMAKASSVRRFSMHIEKGFDMKTFADVQKYNPLFRGAVLMDNPKDFFEAIKPKDKKKA